MDHKDSKEYGYSFEVPSVQELVRKNPHHVPERYIQQKKDRPQQTSFLSSQESTEVPVIDFYSLLNGNGIELQKLDKACKEWGFFQIINHGVSEELLQRTKKATASFFELPLEEKMKYEKDIKNGVDGYSKAGVAYAAKEEEILDWNDMLVLTTWPSNLKNLKHWPLIIPDFKEAVEEYSSEILKLTEDILKNLSLLMGLEKDVLKMLHGEEINLGIRMNHYPTCSKPDLVNGISPHSDASSITVLIQDDHITSLQIRHKETWVPVKPIPNAIVVNIGDVLEAWSNGVYKSIEHRVITNEGAARQSIITFVMPNYDVEFRPVDTMVDEKNNRPRLYQNIKYGDYLKLTLSGKVEGKSNIELLRVAM